MPELTQPRWNYRDDPNVPKFDDHKTLFLFDGICVLCSGGAGWLMRYDRGARLNFASAQSPLGQALYRHYALSMDETYLLLDQGMAYTASAGYLRLCGVLGGLWRVAQVAMLVPERWRDALYGLIARNRYRWFGRTDYCQLLSDDQRRRLL